MLGGAVAGLPMPEKKGARLRVIAEVAVHRWRRSFG
jgi:hypothetical protein